MELIVTFAQDLDPELVELLGIDEDTEFEAFFTDGTLYVRPLSEEEDELDWGCPVTDAVCDGECETCPVFQAAKNSNASTVAAKGGE
ncbi:MAG: hypothetical protein IKO68_08675 [Oscillospiraceae bacterium]|nr:hypothetical protein [Oscillospiraceae bacterium]